MKNFQFSCLRRQAIFNLQKRNIQQSTTNYQQNKGFTFIELLAVVTLVGLIGIIITQIMVLGFRSLGKNEVTKEIKQNGDYILSVMESMVRNSKDISSLQCNSSNSQKLTITNPDGYNTTFDCSAGSKMASISGALGSSISLNSTKVVLDSCSFKIVCPTPPINPKYVFINFSLRYTGSSLTPTPGSYSVVNYQSTVSLRNYQ